jgi:hypothetical protein
MIFEEGIFGDDTFEGSSGLRFYQLSAILESAPQFASYQADSLVWKKNRVPYRMSAWILPRPFYQMSAVLVLDANDPRLSESLINAMLWSYANESEKVSQAIQLMGTRLRLEFASPADLDNYWGEMLKLRRKIGESNDHYRLRLIIHISILNSCGTKPACETILNKIVGLQGASRIESYWPAEVRVCWTNPEAIKLAEQRYPVIEEALDRMIAAGVTWSTSFPYKDYLMSCGLEGPVEAGYQMDAALQQYRGWLYRMDTQFWDAGSMEMDADALIEKSFSAFYKEGACLEANPLVTYSLQAIISKRKPTSYDMAAGFRKNLYSSYQEDLILEQLKPKTLRLNAALQTSFKRFYQMVTAIYPLPVNYQMSAILEEET